MLNFDDVFERLCRTQEILNTAKIIEDEKTQGVLFKTVADILFDTAKMLRPEEMDEEDE